ncbi:MAG TPA: AbrB/MazE/SpoVT family DNA-binding domain-containing protein [Gemmatimonadaceae bacterium]|jgi:AbrB family looped-hinge helix DNA binding protein|nr:AbrB/MazE/SpoVT family DNA-binding domain-containing protein [Gemmatimonadaceae bacterium]
MHTIITVDATGRLVLPKKVREHHGLGPGSEMELDDTETEIRLRPMTAHPPLQEVNGFLVYTGRFTDDTADAVRKDREGRLRHVAGR